MPERPSRQNPNWEAWQKAHAEDPNMDNTVRYAESLVRGFEKGQRTKIEMMEELLRITKHPEHGEIAMRMAYDTLGGMGSVKYELLWRLNQLKFERGPNNETAKLYIGTAAGAEIRDACPERGITKKAIEEAVAQPTVDAAKLKVDMKTICQNRNDPNFSILIALPFDKVVVAPGPRLADALGMGDKTLEVIEPPKNIIPLSKL